MITGQRTRYVLECAVTGETQDVYACQEHALSVSELCRAYPAEDDTACEFCQQGTILTGGHLPPMEHGT